MRRTRDASLAPLDRHVDAPRRPRATGSASASSLPLLTALLALAALSLVAMVMLSASNATDELILSNRPAGFHAEGANGVHPDYEENAILEFAEPTPLDGVAAPRRRFAYLFYVTADRYVCAALHAMRRLVYDLRMDTTRIELVVLYSNGVSLDKVRLLEDQVAARSIPIARILADTNELTWQDSLTKLRVFEDFGYERVVYIDADAVPLQNLDDLFVLPTAPLYAPTAYWLAQPFFATTLMVIEPGNKRFLEILKFARTHADTLLYDMELLNAFFRKTAVFLPPEYTVLNSDFRAPPSELHAAFTVTTSELRHRAKLAHFSARPDGSYGKPWDVETHDVSNLAELGFDPFFGQLFVDYWHTENTFCK